MFSRYRFAKYIFLSIVNHETVSNFKHLAKMNLWTRQPPPADAVGKIIRGNIFIADLNEI